VCVPKEEGECCPVLCSSSWNLEKSGVDDDGCPQGLASAARIIVTLGSLASSCWFLIEYKEPNLATLSDRLEDRHHVRF
jgi:hypothetical protein